MHFLVPSALYLRSIQGGEAQSGGFEYMNRSCRLCLQRDKMMIRYREHGTMLHSLSIHHTMEILTVGDPLRPSSPGGVQLQHNTTLRWDWGPKTGDWGPGIGLGNEPVARNTYRAQQGSQHGAWGAERPCDERQRKSQRPTVVKERSI